MLIRILKLDFTFGIFFYFRSNIPATSNKGGDNVGPSMAATRTDNNSIPNSRRMWTCTNCSYAYNRMWTERCEICENLRTQPSLTQPNLITVTKTDINMTGTYHNFYYISPQGDLEHVAHRISDLTICVAAICMVALPVILLYLRKNVHFLRKNVFMRCYILSKYIVDIQLYN